MSLPAKCLFLDPGESTGWALTQRNKLLEAGTCSIEALPSSLAGTLNVCAPEGELPQHADTALVAAWTGIERVVYEDWAIYPWKADELAWDKCRTARAIGAVEFICTAAGIPYTAQAAKIKDTAEAGGAADLFLRPLHENRHANDAIRHAVYYALAAGEAVGWAG